MFSPDEYALLVEIRGDLTLDQIEWRAAELTVQQVGRIQDLISQWERVSLKSTRIKPTGSDGTDYDPERQKETIRALVGTHLGVQGVSETSSTRLIRT